jgi:nucleoside-diphosphate-sugar epimerase
MRALITGGLGFVGSNLADRLLREGHDVAIFDNGRRAGVRWRGACGGGAPTRRIW